MKLRKLTAVIWLVVLCVALSSICVPAFAADSGAEVYYTSEPTVSGNTVSAKIMNTSGSDVMFIAAAYSGDALADAAVKTVPSGGETAVSATLNGASSGVKCYLWSDNSIAPHGEPVAAVHTVTCANLEVCRSIRRFMETALADEGKKKASDA